MARTFRLSSRQYFGWFRQDGQVVYIVYRRSQFKIGCTGNLPRRMVELQELEPLKLLVVIPGDFALEKQLHQKFRKTRINPKGEWYYPSSELIRFVLQKSTCPIMQISHGPSPINLLPSS